MQDRETALLVLQTIKSNEPELAKDILKQCNVSLERQVDAFDAKLDGSSLFWSSCKGYVELAKMLVSLGADVNCVNCWGATPLHGAAEHNQQSILRFLLKQGSNPNIQTLSGDTACHLAAYRGHSNLVNILLEAGADVLLCNNKGHDVLAEAVTRGRQDISNCIRQKYYSEGINEDRTQYSLDDSCTSLAQGRKRRNNSPPFGYRETKLRNEIQNLSNDASEYNGEKENFGSLPEEIIRGIKNPTVRVYISPQMKQSVQRCHSDPPRNPSQRMNIQGINYLSSPKLIISKYASNPEVSSNSYYQSGSQKSSLSDSSSESSWTPSSLRSSGSSTYSKSWETLSSDDSRKPNSDNWNSMTSHMDYSNDKSSLYVDKRCY